MPRVFHYPHLRAEETDDTLVDVWLHPTEGPQALDEDTGRPRGGPQCAACGSFDPETGEPADEPYRRSGRYVVCVPCGHRYQIGQARADDTVF